MVGIRCSLLYHIAIYLIKATHQHVYLHIGSLQVFFVKPASGLSSSIACTTVQFSGHTVDLTAFKRSGCNIYKRLVVLIKQHGQGYLQQLHRSVHGFAYVNMQTGTSSPILPRYGAITA